MSRATRLQNATSWGRGEAWVEGGRGGEGGGFRVWGGEGGGWQRGKQERVDSSHCFAPHEDVIFTPHKGTAKLWCHPGYVLTQYTAANSGNIYGGRIPEDFEVNILVSQQICRERLERDWEVSQYILGWFLGGFSVDTVL